MRQIKIFISGQLKKICGERMIKFKYDENKVDFFAYDDIFHIFSSPPPSDFVTFSGFSCPVDILIIRNDMCNKHRFCYHITCFYMNSVSYLLNYKDTNVTQEKRPLNA